MKKEEKKIRIRENVVSHLYGKRATTLCTSFSGAQDIIVHPRMTPEMIQIHLIIIADLFLVMSMCVSSEYDHVVAWNQYRKQCNTKLMLFFTLHKFQGFQCPHKASN